MTKRIVIFLCAIGLIANGQSNKTPIINGILQSDFDCAHFNLLNVNLSFPGKFVDVTGSPYNADKTGAVEASAIINQAMSDVATAGGGTVFFPKGIYKCDAAPTAGVYNSILNIPWSGNNIPFASPPSVSLVLLGEIQPSHGVVNASADANSSTIKTTRTGDTLPAALMAGNSYRGLAAVGGSSYTDRNGTFLTVKNLNFILPSNPQLHGLRLEGMGNVRFESVNVVAGGGQPTVNSVGIWTPNSENWGENLVDYVLVSGFQTGLRTGEHLFSRQILANLCAVGVDFAGSIYTSYANLQIINCIDGIKFTGYHPVDLLVINEHSGSGWYAASHDISDVNNYGAGTIRHFVGNGGLGTFTPVTLLGGTGLTIIESFTGDIKMASTAGAGGSTQGATLLSNAVKLRPTTFANRITSPPQGTIQPFTDSTTAVWGATITGSGANPVLGYYDGTNWTVMAK